MRMYGGVGVGMSRGITWDMVENWRISNEIRKGSILKIEFEFICVDDDD